MPAALTTLYRSLHVLPEKVVLLSIQVEDIPFIDLEKNIRLYRMPENIDHVTVRRGYLDPIDAPLILEAARAKGASRVPHQESARRGKHDTLKCSRVNV